MAQKSEHCEHCEHCGKMLGKEEQAFVYEGQIVCHQCNDSLRHPVYITQTKNVSGLGIAALVLGLIACLGCWIPMCGIFSLPFAMLGILFGGIGIIIAKLKKKSYVGLPIAGTIVSITAVFIVIAVTGSVVSSLEKSRTTITEGLDKAEATLSEAGVTSSIEKSRMTITEDLDKTEAGIENTTKQNQEKQAYIDKVKIINLEVAKTVFDKWGVFGEIKNTGNRTLTEVEITIYYLDGSGNTIYEDIFHPVRISRWSSDNKPLKPNYSEKFGYGIDDVSSEWSKKIEAYVTNIEFGE